MNIHKILSSFRLRGVRARKLSRPNYVGPLTFHSMRVKSEVKFRSIMVGLEIFKSLSIDHQRNFNIHEINIQSDYTFSTTRLICALFCLHKQSRATYEYKTQSYQKMCVSTVSSNMPGQSGKLFHCFLRRGNEKSVTREGGAQLLKGCVITMKP